VKELVAPGPWWSPTCAQDGNFVFYVALDEEQKILGVPIQGGNSSKLAGILGEGITSNLTVSPNGKLLAYAFHVRKQEPIRKLAVVSSLDGHPVQLINLPKGISLYWVLLRWSHDGKSLYYLGTQNGATSLWEQPLAGGVPKQLMKFQGPEVIFDFNWTADGKQLLLSRGEITSDVVLLTNLR
jgi:Tol biopolymer transport system component